MPSSTLAAATETEFDVVILSGGIASSILANILAANGVDVLIVSPRSHPSFAIGESTIPRTSMYLRIMAERYGVPELADLTHITSGPTSNGIKRNFGFVYHRPGEAQRAREQYQTLIPERRHGPESHLFRQDVDADLLFRAIERGATVIQDEPWTDIDIDDDGVRVRAKSGREYRGRYLVDGSGPRSPFALDQDIRVPDDALDTRSRTIFTHMINVPPYEDVQGPDYPDMPRRWSQGTLHHVFDGGWIWVIPFDNHDDSTNRLCSVGLTLDIRKHPTRGADPEAEFREFIAQYPGIARQFESARSVRSWVSTGRLQFNSRVTTGPRYCLMSHTSGFIDALFSRGLANTSALINALAHRLIAAKADGDYSQARFAGIDDMHHRMVQGNDRLVACSFKAWGHHELWNAWVRLWVIGTFFDWLRLNRIHDRYLANHDAGELAALEPGADDFPHSLCPQHPEYDQLFDRCARAIESVDDSDPQAMRAAADTIMAELKSSGILPPVMKFDDPDRQHDVILGLKEMAMATRWIDANWSEAALEAFRGRTPRT